MKFTDAAQPLAHCLKQDSQDFRITRIESATERTEYTGESPTQY